MYTIIDAHAHLWLNQNTTVDGMDIRSLPNGRAHFMGEIRQMLPPYIIDGRNTAEILISNMDYAQVAAAVITQEYIDGSQNEYLRKVQKIHPDRLLCCGLVDARTPGYLEEGIQLIEEHNFQAIKIPAGRLIMGNHRVRLTSAEMMRLFRIMADNDIILSIDLADGDEQVGEMKELIAEYPTLRIAIGHFGMVTRPRWQEQIRLALSKNVYIESGGITWLFHNEFYPYHGAIRAICEAADLVGIDKLMWGSDYPRTMTAITYKMSYDFILKSALPQESQALFLGQNAIRFYRFRNIHEMEYIKNMVE